MYSASAFRRLGRLAARTGGDVVCARGRVEHVVRAERGAADSNGKANRWCACSTTARSCNANPCATLGQRFRHVCHTSRRGPTRVWRRATCQPRGACACARLCCQGLLWGRRHRHHQPARLGRPTGCERAQLRQARRVHPILRHALREPVHLDLPCASLYRRIAGRSETSSTPRVFIPRCHTQARAACTPGRAPMPRHQSSEETAAETLACSPRCKRTVCPS